MRRSVSAEHLRSRGGPGYTRSATTRYLILFLLFTVHLAGSLRAADSLTLVVPEPATSSFQALEEVIDPVPVPIDSQWWDGFGRAGVSGRVTSLALHDGDVIVAGDFREAGSIRSIGVARWDGSSWTPFGSGVTGVEALAVYDGEVVAGGWCSCGDDCILRWDGSAWTRMGGGIRAGDYINCWEFPDEVYALAVFNDKLVAGGLFYSGEEENPDSYLAQWDGESWSSLGSTVNSWVRAMAVYEGSLIVGGNFMEAGEIPANRIAAWDGSNWSPLGTGIQDDIRWAGRHVSAMTVHEGKLFVGGVFSKAGSLEVDRLAYWDGTAWNSTGFEAGGYVDGDVPSINALAVYDGDLIAGGRFREEEGAVANFIASWDGTTWKNLGPGPDGVVETLMPYGDVLLVGGEFTFVESRALYNFAIWDGAAWHPVGWGQGLSHGVRSLVVYEDQLVAGGKFHAAGELPASHVAAWDGSAWTALGNAWVGPDKTVPALTTFEGNLVGVDRKVVMRWSGVSWDTLTSEFNGQIRAVAVYGGELVASGNEVASWDGASWTTLGTPPGEGYVDALGVFGEELIVGGQFAEINGTEARNVAGWDGSAWRPLGEGLAGYENVVNAIGVYEGDLIAGGSFNRSGSKKEVKCVARWDGQSWNSVGRGLSRDINPHVYALATYNGTLIAAGDIRWGNGKKTWNVARWNGATWHPIGSGIGIYEIISYSPVRYRVDALAVHEGCLYAGGAFRYAGGKNSFFLARWEDEFPGMVMNFTADPDDKSVRLEWQNPAAEVCEGTLIRYSTSDYPTSSTDGDPVPNGNDGRFDGPAGRDSFFVHHGLANGVTYYYCAFAYNGMGAYSMPAVTSSMPADSTDPGPVTDFRATPVAGGVKLEWTNPADDDFVETLISVSKSEYPTDPDRTTQHVPNGNDGRFEGEPGSDGLYIDNEASGGFTYYYSAWTYDESHNHSVAAHASMVREIDTLLVFRANPLDRRVQLIWANPYDVDFNSTYIRFSTEGFPLSVTDGDPVSSANDGRFEGKAGRYYNFPHEGLASGVRYYYSGFVCLSDPIRFSQPVMRWAVPSGPDDVPPGLSVGVLQNPYLTQYLDIYLVATEALDSASVDVRLNGDQVEMTMLDGVEHVWRGDYKLTGAADSLSIDACASDSAGNQTCVTVRISVSLISKGEGGSVLSPDGRLKLSVPQGAVSRDAYVLVIPCETTGSDLPGRGDEITFAATDQELLAYHLSPVGLLAHGSGHIEINYCNLDAWSGMSPDRIYIEHVGVGPIKSYVDPAGKAVSATVTALGTFRLAAGAPGTSQFIDPAYLSVQPARPNPFSQRTTVCYELRDVQRIRATVFDIRGREIISLVDGPAYPGFSQVVWDGSSEDAKLPSGVYFLRIETPHATRTSKVLLIR